MQLTRPKKQRKEGSFATLCERFTNPLAQDVGLEPLYSTPNAACKPLHFILYIRRLFVKTVAPSASALRHRSRVIYTPSRQGVSNPLIILPIGPGVRCYRSRHLRPNDALATFATAATFIHAVRHLHLMAWLGPGGVEPPDEY